MKVAPFLQLVAVSSAFVIPDEKLMLDVETKPRASHFDSPPSKSELLGNARDIVNGISHKAHDVFDQCSYKAQDLFDETTSTVSEGIELTRQALKNGYVDAQGFVQSAVDDEEVFGLDDILTPNHPERRRPGHGHKPNMTVYQLIANSKYTTKLAELINDYDDLVEALNSTKANYTVFAPTDYAFSKIPKHAPKPSKEQLKEVLLYHVSADFYPAGRILNERTIPSLLKSSELGKEPRSQRLGTNISLRGLTINFYSRIIAVNIFGSNGVIHGVDSIIIPPPKALKIVEFFPSGFSTLELGLQKTDLLQTLNETKFKGSTWFLPDNSAFDRLGFRVTSFLFSPYGLKYLKALLQYHVVPDRTLYSDAYFGSSSEDDKSIQQGPSRGYFHVDLPTLLEDRSLDVNIARYGRFIQIKINGFYTIRASDAVTRDGVAHIPYNVLIPPKKLQSGKFDYWDGSSELTQEELIERLEPMVE